MDLLEKLINAHGVSGNEEQVRQVVRKAISKYVDSVKIDKIGNLICHKKGNKPTVMIAAHLDEVGLMVKSIDDKGRIKFATVGEIEVLALVGQRVKIELKSGNYINGVISSPDLTDGLVINELPLLEDLFIDIGLNSKKEVLKKGIRPGRYVSFDFAGFTFLGNKNIVSGKALDDRIGCFILCELAKKLYKTKNEVFYVFTAQEEVGMYGAKTSIYSINPEYSIVVDVANTDEENKNKLLGKGPCIIAKDAEMLGNKCINNWFEETGKKLKIPIQFDVSDLGTTDALSISFAKGGIPSSAIGVSVKNMHSTVSIASRKDINNCIKILERLLKNPPKKCIV